MLGRKILFSSLNRFTSGFTRRFEGNFKIEQKPEVFLDSPLTDTFGRHHTYLRISLTEKCNLRCQYCMPPDGVNLTEKSKLLTAEEVIYLAKFFVDQGVEKIRLTGGEPTTRKDLADIIYNLKQIRGLQSVTLTTNGVVLTKKLVDLQRAGLDGLNISLDTLDKKKYEKITRRKGMERVLMGIDLALQLGYNPVKINCVIMKGFNDDEVVDFVKLTQDKNLDVRFIEYMPFSGNKWEVEKMVPYKSLLSRIRSVYPDFFPLKNGPNDTSKAWKVQGFAGQVGFITSMSDMFCGTCNRLRITADGNLKACLFGNKEVSLRDAIRNGIKEDDLANMIGVAVRRKEKHHGGYENFLKIDKEALIPGIKSKRRSPFVFILRRMYSTYSKEENLTHVDGEGKAKMVDVSDKDVTSRTATARGTVQVGPEITRLIKENSIKKGDVLGVSKLAGILAAKKTSDLIPLCHNISLNGIDVTASLDENNDAVVIEATVSCVGKTGVEMEALVAVSVAALTVYDMCKSVSKSIRIKDVHLVRKTGGSKGDHGEPPLQLKSYKEVLRNKTVYVGGI
ncbi:molybdenum cofactor biosynthesis protein 1 [Harmonia axyridis]|uniref:molybdenum cofactor biosynthesis protein 1 n=1 Tax=Harmonia axyridis TaxID=115357 RepID=UPI001E275496|nr:molybdenum cofactor biosynthesis protein 1 [Harmonia axyridis]